MTAPNGRSVRSETDEHGVFVFDDVPDNRAVFEVRGAVHLGAHPPTVKRLNAGTRAGTVPVHPGHAFLLLLDEPTGRPGRGEARLQVAATNGDASGTGVWSLAHPVALVTGAATDAFYDVLVQSPSGKRAVLVECVAAGQQVVVALDPSTTVHGRVELPPGASPRDVEVVLTHGRLRVPARVSEHGWQVDHLPRDSWWDVTARWRGRDDPRQTTQTGIHAGSEPPVVLDLR